MPSSKVVPVVFTIAQGATESDIQEIQNPVDGVYAAACFKLHTAITSVAGRLQLSATDATADFMDVHDPYGNDRTVQFAATGYYTVLPGEYAIIDRFARIKLASAASVATKVTMFLRVA